MGAVYCVLCDDTHPLVGNGGVRGHFGMKLSLDKKYYVNVVLSYSAFWVRVRVRVRK